MNISVTYFIRLYIFIIHKPFMFSHESTISSFFLPFYNLTFQSVHIIIMFLLNFLLCLLVFLDTILNLFF